MLISILLLIIILLMPSSDSREDWDKDYRVPTETNKRKKITRRVIKQGDMTLGEEITEEYDE
jgi:hypothetical protein